MKAKRKCTSSDLAMATTYLSLTSSTASSVGGRHLRPRECFDSLTFVGIPAAHIDHRSAGSSVVICSFTRKFSALISSESRPTSAAAAFSCNQGKLHEDIVQAHWSHSHQSRLPVRLTYIPRFCRCASPPIGKAVPQPAICPSMRSAQH